MREEEFWKKNKEAYLAYCKFIHPYDKYVSVRPVDEEVWFVGGWDSCKNKVLKILDKYRHVPAYPYIKSDIEKL